MSYSKKAIVNIIIFMDLKISLEVKNDVNDMINLNESISHCPKCIQQVILYFIKENEIYFKCRNGHEGKTSIKEYLKEINQTSLNNLACFNCNEKNDELVLCLGCQNIICQNIDCKNEHLTISHSHSNLNTVKINDYDNACPKHCSEYYYYCEDCGVNLCDKCDNYHCNHSLIKFFPDDEFFEDIKQKFSRIQKDLETFSKKINFVIQRLIRLYKNFQYSIQYQKKFIENIVNSYEKKKNNENLNYEIIKNIKNLEFDWNFKKHESDKEILKFLYNKNFSILRKKDIPKKKKEESEIIIISKQIK